MDWLETIIHTFCFLPLTIMIAVGVYKRITLRGAIGYDNGYADGYVDGQRDTEAYFDAIEPPDSEVPPIMGS